MKQIEKVLIGKFKEICSNSYYEKPNSLIKPFDTILDYKLDYNDQFQRGIQIENILIRKILKLNESKTLHWLLGEIREEVYEISRGFTVNEWHIESLLFKHLNTLNKKFKEKDVDIKSPEPFEAKYRCLTQPKIDTCLPDLIVDDTIIDIKTDINSKKLKNYVKQVFIQTIQYTSFLKSTKQYSPKFHDLNIEMIERPINNIAVYYWRLNEFYKIPLNEILLEQEFDDIVDMYTTLRSLHGAYLRLIAKKNLFIS